MVCPQCNEVVVYLSRKCGSCGYAYDEKIYEKLSLYFDLKSDLERVRSVAKNDLWPGLQKISNQMARYEKLLGEDLAGLSHYEQPSGEPSGRALQAPSGPAAAEADAMSFGESLNMKDRVHEWFGDKALGVSATQNKTEAAHAVKAKNDTSQFEINLGQKWLLIIGIVTMVFGIGYFLKYSFEQGCESGCEKSGGENVITHFPKTLDDVKNCLILAYYPA